MKRPRIERKNGRIYFGEGEQQWSCWDPGFAESDVTRSARSGDWTWLINCTPTVRELLVKVRLIRWAVTHVEIQRPAPKKEGT